MDNVVPSDKLRKTILISIRREEVRRARVYLAAAFAMAGGSAVGVALSVWYAVIAVSRSSFVSYVSLLFSDSDILALYWREFALSLVETLPLFAITLVLLTLVSFFASARMVANGVRGKKGLLTA